MRPPKGYVPQHRAGVRSPGPVAPIRLCVHGLIRCDAHVTFSPGAAQVRWTQHTKQMPAIERTQR